MVSKTDAELAHNLRNLVARLRRSFRKQAGALGQLSIAEENVLRILIHEDDVLPSEFCTRLNLSSQFVSQVLNHLEETDYITRKSSLQDKRKTLVSLSKQGRQRVDSFRKEKEEWLASVISKNYTAQQKETIRQAVELLSGLRDL